MMNVKKSFVEDVYDYILNRSGAIYIDEKLVGSGAFISSDGYFITCAHLGLEKFDHFHIKHNRLGKIKARVINVSKEVDVSLIKCDVGGTVEFFHVSEKFNKIGRKIFYFGFPDREGFKDGYSRESEIVSIGTTTFEGKKINIYGIDGSNVTEGMSGGPVIDSLTKCLIGIIHGYDKVLEKSIYDKQKFFIGSVSRRLDDLYIPVNLALSCIPLMRNVTKIFDNNPNMLERTIEILNLLGFETKLTDYKDSNEFLIHCILKLSLFSFERIVFCATNEIKLDNELVTKFKILADHYIKSKNCNIEKITIVAEFDVDKETVEFADNIGIEIFSIESLFENLINFTNYASKALYQWENDPSQISSKFIDLSFKRIEPNHIANEESMLTFLEDWIKNSSKTKLLILGKYGSGKTTTCRYLFYHFSLQNTEKITGRLPIYIRLKDAKSQSLKQIIIDIMENELNNRGSSFSLFSKLNETGKLLMILDGFDEMSQQSGKLSFVENIKEITKLLSKKSKVIITSRVEYFIENKNIDTLLSMNEFSQLYSQDDYDVILLNDFSHDQIINFLTKSKDHEEAIEMYQRIINIPNLVELAERPILLEMISQTYSKFKNWEEISIAKLYDLYITNWLERDVVSGRSSIDSTLKIEIMKEIAKKMNELGCLSLHYDDLLNVISPYFNNELGRISFYLHDILTNSFLTRNDRDKTYEFAHKSFYEYFLSKALVKDIQHLLHSPAQYFCSFGERRLSYEILKFMEDLGMTELEYLALINRTKNRSFKEVRFLGGNSITALRFLKYDFRNRNFDDTILAGAILSGCDLSESSFVNTCLFDTGLDNTITANCDFSNADLTRSAFKSSKSIYSLDYSPSRKLLAIGSTTKNISVWEFDDHFSDCKKFILSGHADYVHKVIFSPCGNRLISGSKDQSIRVWDWINDDSFSLRGHVGDLRGIVFLSDMELASCSPDDGQVVVWNLATHSLLDSANFDKPLWGIDFNKIRNLLAVSALDGSIYLLKSSDLSIYKSTTFEHGQIRSIKFIKNKDLIICGCQDGSIILFNYIDDSYKVVHKDNYTITAVEINNDESLIASGNGLGDICIWDIDNLDLLTKIKGHNDNVTEIKFDNERPMIFSTSSDGTIAIWAFNDFKMSLTNRIEEEFENDIFNCAGLKITNIRGLSEERIQKLISYGAVV